MTRVVTMGFAALHPSYVSIICRVGGAKRNPPNHAHVDTARSNHAMSNYFRKFAPAATV
jgi:hypothetical protein